MRLVIEDWRLEIKKMFEEFAQKPKLKSKSKKLRSKKEYQWKKPIGETDKNKKGKKDEIENPDQWRGPSETEIDEIDEIDDHSDGRDVRLEFRTTWSRKVFDCLQPDGTDHRKAWFTHAAIRKRLARHCAPDAIPGSIKAILIYMVKDGLLERARKPPGITDLYCVGREYLYRITGRSYRLKTGKPPRVKDRQTLDKGLQLKLDHPKLAKWFRDMMH